MYLGILIQYTKVTSNILTNRKHWQTKCCLIVNNDLQRALKGSKEFQQEQERVFIASNIKSVNHCILSIDQDRTVCKTIEKIALDFGEDYDLSFSNGGDQNNNTIPERSICDQMGITLIDGLGDKIQSSSWLLKK